MHLARMAADAYDVIVIGAGQSGIIAARFYLDTHPDARLLLVEKGASIGGVWGKGRAVSPLHISMNKTLSSSYVKFPTDSWSRARLSWLHVPSIVSHSRFLRCAI